MYSPYPQAEIKQGLNNPTSFLIKYFAGKMDSPNSQEIHDNNSELEMNRHEIIKKGRKRISQISTLISNKCILLGKLWIIVFLTWQKLKESSSDADLLIRLSFYSMINVVFEKLYPDLGLLEFRKKMLKT